MGGDWNNHLFLIDLALFQSTPPHGGRRRWRDFMLVAQAVSIHAPAWGATVTAPTVKRAIDVSIHAPAWGATFSSVFSFPALLGFNPRPRMGGDRDY